MHIVKLHALTNSIQNFKSILAAKAKLRAYPCTAGVPQTAQNFCPCTSGVPHCGQYFQAAPAGAAPGAQINGTFSSSPGTPCSPPGSGFMFCRSNPSEYKLNVPSGSCSRWSCRWYHSPNPPIAMQNARQQQHVKIAAMSLVQNQDSFL